MSASASIKVHLDSDGFIREDVDCPECHYNLRGIPPSGACPECGKPVSNALTAMQFSDPAWIFCLAGGLNWIKFSIYFSIVFTILAALLDGITVFQGNSQPQFASSLLLLLPELAYGWGIWKFTTPENTTRVGETPLARPLTRYAILLSSALLWIPEFLPASSKATPAPISKVPLDQYQKLITDWSSTFSFGTSEIIYVSAMSASFLLMLVGTFAALIYARQIARRIPDKKLARNTGIIMWGLIATGALFVLMILLAIMSVILSANQASVVTAVAMIFPGCGCILGVLIFGGWAFMLLSQFRKKLKIVGQRAALRSVESSDERLH